MKRWEYRHVTGTTESWEAGDSFEEQLNDLGGEGWELVHFTALPTSPVTLMAVLKRERSFARPEEGHSSFGGSH